MSQYQLEVATAADADNLVELRVAAMRQSLEAIGRFDPERARTRFLSTFVAAETQKIMLNGVMVGFYVFRKRDGDYWLDHLYLSPDSQSSGIGSAVLNALKQQAAATNDTIKLGALRDSRSNQFYQNNGFVLYQETELDLYYRYEPN